MSLEFSDSRITGHMLRADPKSLKRMIRNMENENYSPKVIAKTFKKKYSISKKTIARKTGIVLSARPPNKKENKLDATDKVLPPLKVLKERYKDFNEHYMIYQQALRSAYYLGHMFTSREFASTGGSTSNYFNNLDEFESPQFRKPISEVNRAKHGRYLRVRPDYIETIVDLTDTMVSIGYSNTEFANKNRLDAARILQTYFPDFKIPTEWKIVKEKHPYYEDKTVDRITIDMPTLEVEHTLDKISSLRPNYTHINDQNNPKTKWNHPDYIKVPSGFPKKFLEMASLRMTLNGDEAVVSNEYRIRQEGMERGPLSVVGASTNTHIPITMQLVVRWPREFACYVTSCRTYKDFIPFLFYQYISYHRVAYGGMRNRKGNFTIEAPKRVNHLGLVLEDIETEKKEGRDPKPKTNEDDMLIVGLAEPSMTGEVLWIPHGENRVKEYVTQIKNSYDPETEKIDFQGFTLKGKGLLTDWHNEKFSYVREAGLGSATDAADASGIQTFDLLGSKPLDITTISRDLNTALVNDEDGWKALAGYLNKLVQTDPMSTTQYATPKKAYNSQEFLATDPEYAAHSRVLARNVIDLMNMLIGSLVGITPANIGGVPIDTDEPDRYIVEKVVCRYIREILEDAYENFDTLEMGYQARMSMRYYFLLILKYSKKHAEYKKISAEIEAKNRLGSEVMSDQERAERYGDVSKVPVVNLPGLQMMMPHQVETFTVMASEPSACFTDIHMGGGKTLIGTLEALQLIHKSRIKRPLFIVPSNLVRSWINEINHYSKGAVNPFAITLRSMRRLQEALQVGDYKNLSNPVSYDLMKAIIEDCPPNTLFITSYNFLRSDLESVLYANKDISRYLAAEALRDIGFEAVFLDESHKAKNLGTSQTKATAILTSAAKYVRMMSGTLVNNTLTDLVGQAAMANPAIYGRAKEFNAKYGDGNSGTVTVWQADAPQRMIDDAKPYMQRVTHKRQRWAFVLPKLEENFHPVPFTEKQQEFYDDTLNEVLGQLLDDPKLRAKLSVMTEAEQSAIIKKLTEDPAFQELEKFVYAPDTHEGFMALDDIDEADKVSPKIPKLVELLQTHFTPQKDIQTGKMTEQQHKVLVFSYRKPQSEHIMRHLPEEFRKMAVHYVAGDFQALESFLKNPKMKILVANETSINTGQNLQIASRLIRMETLWSPGDQDQALARIWRPDFKGLNARPIVYSDWIFTDGSLEVAKIGRIVSKIVDKMKYDWQESPQFSKQPFEFPESRLKQGLRRSIPSIDERIPVNDMLLSLPLISMNIDSLKNLRRASQITEYFATFSLISNWENIEFDRQKNQKWAKVVDIPASSHVSIKGSAKLAWVPRIEGVDPDIIDPEGKFGYKPISVVESTMALENEDEEDSETLTIREVNACNINDLVDTEFGIGFIKKILNDRVVVNIPGIENDIKVSKAATWLITNTEMAAKLKKQLRTAGKKGLARLPGAVVEEKIQEQAPGAKPPVAPKEQDASSPKTGGGGVKPPRPRRPEKTEHYDDKDADVTDFDNEIDVYAEIIDGQIALTCLAEDSDSEVLVDHFGFKPIAPYYAVKVNTARGLSQLLNLLKRNFTIKKVLLDNFKPYIDMMRTGQLGQHDPAQFAETLQFFRIDNHNQAANGEIRPFPIVWGGRLYIAVDKSKTPSSSMFLRVCRTAGIAGVESLENPLQDGVHVRMFRNKAAAIKVLHDIIKKVKVDNQDETLKFLRALKSTKMDREDEEEAPAPRNRPRAAPEETQVRVTRPRQVTRTPPAETPRARTAPAARAPANPPRLPDRRSTTIVEEHDEEINIPARNPRNRPVIRRR